jgi:hypothetical protein
MTSMSERMITGIIDRCLEVTTEAWSRKDRQSTVAMSKSKSAIKFAASPSGFDFQSTASVDDLFDEIMEVQADQAEAQVQEGVTKDRNASFALIEDPASIASSVDEPKNGWSTNALRSRLNWLAVMHDWKWQIMLG